MPEASQSCALRVRLSGFDYLVFAGGAVNVLIIAYLMGHWLLAG